MSLFITCPVESVDRAAEFYTALGWTLNAEMSDHNVSCFAIAPEQYVMLGSREEAMGYTDLARSIWENVPDCMEWVERVAKEPRQGAMKLV